jgi:cullin 3
VDISHILPRFANHFASRQRRKLAHANLITEVITQLASRFNPEPPIIKRRIEDLIARDFLERVENEDVPTYSYVA